MPESPNTNTHHTPHTARRLALHASTRPARHTPHLHALRPAQDGELPTLPLSIDGAVAMAHTPGDDTAVSGDEWFVFKFDKQQVRGSWQHRRPDGV
eukprot:362655-Chlamydomonas_euryale.AAC.8